MEAKSTRQKAREWLVLILLVAGIATVIILSFNGINVWKLVTADLSWTSWIAEVILIGGFAVYSWLHILYRQDKKLVFEFDGTVDIQPHALCAGDDTSLYADCGLLSANIYRKKQPLEERVSYEDAVRFIKYAGENNEELDLLSYRFFLSDERIIHALTADDIIDQAGDIQHRFLSKKKSERLTVWENVIMEFCKDNKILGMDKDLFLQSREQLPENRIHAEGWAEVYMDIPSVGDNTGNGLAIEVWRNDNYKNRKLFAIVFRGTVGGWSSWRANLHWIYKWLPIRDHYDHVKELVPQIIDALRRQYPHTFDEYEVIATGHSLGGGLAQHACYVQEEVKMAYVFNSSPVTGYTDFKQPKDEGVKIYRLYEKGEVLQYLRFFMKIVYLFDPRPNRDPYIKEHRLNFNYKDAAIISEHGITSLACGLKWLGDPLNKDKMPGYAAAQPA